MDNPFLMEMFQAENTLVQLPQESARKYRQFRPTHQLHGVGFVVLRRVSQVFQDATIIRPF